MSNTVCVALFPADSILHWTQSHRHSFVENIERVWSCTSLHGPVDKLGQVTPSSDFELDCHISGEDVFLGECVVCRNFDGSSSH